MDHLQYLARTASPAAELRSGRGRAVPTCQHLYCTPGRTRVEHARDDDIAAADPLTGWIRAVSFARYGEAGGGGGD